MGVQGGGGCAPQLMLSIPDCRRVGSMENLMRIDSDEDRFAPDVLQ
jgi:hypothetical protein